MTVSGTSYISTSLNRNSVAFCDLELDIGLIPGLSDAVTAANNTRLLNEALDAQRTSGSLRFRSGGQLGPIVYEIRCPAKEFFFSGVIKTPVRIGGVLRGSGGRAYPMLSAFYDTDSVGGVMTRFTWIDGSSTSACIRLRGCGFELSNIQINGRPYTADRGAGEGPATGTKANVGIEVEGRVGPIATGGHVIMNCVISDCTYGICCRAGYYDDSGQFVADENHADTSSVWGTLFHANASCFRSENQQSLDWRFYNNTASCWGGAGRVPVTVFDCYRGGNIESYGLTLLHPQATLLRVNDYSPWGNRFGIYGVYRDRYESTQDYYLTLFKYSGTGFPDSSFLDWSVRVTGNLPQTADEYDVSRLIDITPSSVNFPLDDLLFDMKRMPHDDFESVGGGYWKPTTDWL